MESAEELRSQARKCRALAAGITDEETRRSLELLARDYDRRAAEAEGTMPPQPMPEPE
jgi:hypothetical protein